jgi:hypothetical protein
LTLSNGVGGYLLLFFDTALFLRGYMIWDEGSVSTEKFNPYLISMKSFVIYTCLGHRVREDPKQWILTCTERRADDGATTSVHTCRYIYVPSSPTTVGTTMLSGREATNIDRRS